MSAAASDPLISPVSGVLAGCAWLLGLGLLLQCERLPNAAEWVSLLCLCALMLAGLPLLLWATWRRAWPRYLFALSLCLTACLLAFMQGAWRAERRLAEQLPPAWEGRDLRLTGRIDSLPSQVQGAAGLPGWRFEFEVMTAQDAGAAAAPGQDLRALLPGRLALSWYGESRSPPPLRAGEQWQFTARLKRPHGLMNPHGFDAEFWLFEQGLRATGVVRAAGPGGPPLRLAPASACGWDVWRQALREALQREVSDPSVAGVLAALSLGDQAAISSQDWALFRSTGVSHLLSVSGLHVTMFAWLAQALVASLWRRSAWLCLRCPAPLVARWLGVAAALAYAMFSGWGVPAQRTVWMLLCVAALRSLSLRWPWPICLLLAALLVTVIDPWAVGQAGFWLSFAAVALLMASGGSEPPPQGWREHLRQGLRSQWVATLGLAPLSLLFFQQISLVGLVANGLAIPVVSFVITPLAMAGAVWPGLWTLAELAVRALLLGLQTLAALPWAVWFVPAAPGWAQALGLLGGSLLVMPLPWRLRLCGLCMALPMCWPAPVRPPVGEFELLAADIGQGTALLLRTSAHQVLYDSGPSYGPSSDAGQRVLLPLMRALGVRELDALVLSHRDSDHVGGAAAILAAMPVKTLLSSLEPGHRLLSLAHESRLQRCEQGQSWRWDGVQFELFHPPVEFYAQGQEPKKSNAMSCVLKVSSSSGRSVLLTGDLEAPQELALLTAQSQGRLGQGLRSEVLIAPHHGSKTSSSEAFLLGVAPRLAVFQAGYRNRFAHPALSVLARYQDLGISTLLQPACGAWRWFSATGEERCQREQAQRFWHLSPVYWAQQVNANLEAGPWPQQEMPAEDAELLGGP